MLPDEARAPRGYSEREPKLNRLHFICEAKITKSYSLMMGRWSEHLGRYQSSAPDLRHRGVSWPFQLRSGTGSTESLCRGSVKEVESEFVLDCATERLAPMTEIQC